MSNHKKLFFFLLKIESIKGDTVVRKSIVLRATVIYAIPARLLKYSFIIFKELLMNNWRTPKIRKKRSFWYPESSCPFSLPPSWPSLSLSWSDSTFRTPSKLPRSPLHTVRAGGRGGSIILHTQILYFITYRSNPITTDFNLLLLTVQYPTLTYRTLSRSRTDFPPSYRNPLSTTR